MSSTVEGSASSGGRSRVVSRLLVVDLVVTVVVNVLSWTAFLTDDWGWTDCRTHSPSYGLWRWCRPGDDQAGDGGDNGHCLSLVGAHEDLTSFAALQAFSVVGYVGLNVTLGAMIGVVIASKLKASLGGLIKKIAIAFASLGAVGWLLAILVFAGEWPHSDGGVGYSFALGVVSFVGAAVVAVLIIVDVLKGAGSAVAAAEKVHPASGSPTGASAATPPAGTNLKGEEMH